MMMRLLDFGTEYKKLKWAKLGHSRRGPSREDNVGSMKSDLSLDAALLAGVHPRI